MTSSIKLKPCPFCGGKARISFCDYKFIGQNFKGDKKIKYRVQAICNKCYSRGMPIITDGLINPRPYCMIKGDSLVGRQAEMFNPYIDKAIEAWNRRVDNVGNS